MAGQQRIITLPRGPAGPIPERLPSGTGSSHATAADLGETATIVHPATIHAPALLPQAVARREVLLGFWDNVPQRAVEMETRPKRSAPAVVVKQHLPSRFDSPMVEVSVMLFLTIIAILIERLAIYWFMVPF